MISIHIKLMGMLQDKTPLNGTLDLPDNATIQSVLDFLAIDSNTVHVFTVNGDLTRDKSLPLESGIELVVLPPVGGG